jgi:oxepin-CoA hydrolase/3-oxo-5,6-dehydrosuberyl-CoA semialdehyde dehydrogenase
MKLESFARGQWVSPGHELAEMRSAVNGDVIATAAHGGLDMSGVLAYARDVGGPNLRRLTFHQRAELLKKLAQYISERKDQLYK